MGRMHDKENAYFQQGTTVRIYFPPTGVAGGTPTFPVVQGRILREGQDGIVLQSNDGGVVAFSWDHIAGVAQV